MRAWEMALRRTGLPLRMTEGFNPRVKLSMPMALGLGIASEDEIIEIELDGWCTAEEVRGELESELPPGLLLTELSLLAPGQRGQVAWVEYALRLDDDQGGRLQALLDMQAVVVDRVREGSRQPLDIRPYLMEVRREATEVWRVRLRVTPRGTARPDEVLRAIGIEGPAVLALLTKLRTELETPPPPCSRPAFRR